MKILFFVLGLFSSTAFAGPCAELVKVIDPDPNKIDTNRAAVIGKLSITFRTLATNQAASCSIEVTNIVGNRSYVFSDDGSIGLSDTMKNSNSKVHSDGKETRFKTYMLLPQEKDRNFSASRNGKLVSIKMNSGEFIFDTELGKIISSPSLDIQDTSEGLKVNQPRALWVDYGTAMGVDPRTKPGRSATVYNRDSTCQVQKDQMYKKISKWDQIMKLNTEAEQIAFFKKSCIGTQFNIEKLPAASAQKSKLGDVINSLPGDGVR